MRIEGFHPVIINITPVINMTPLLLSDWSETKDDDYDLSFNWNSEPVNRIERFTLEKSEEVEMLS